MANCSFIHSACSVISTWFMNSSVWFDDPFSQLLYAAMNLTSNEMFNYKRYNYLKNARGKYHNPFSRGVCHNMAEYFACISPAEPEHASIRDLWIFLLYYRKTSVAQRSELTFITENIRVWQSTLVWKLETLREINYIVASKLAFFYELQFILKQTKK